MKQRAAAIEAFQKDPPTTVRCFQSYVVCWQACAHYESALERGGLTVVVRCVHEALFWSRQGCLVDEQVHHA
jgi:hypothetical protein